MNSQQIQSGRIVGKTERTYSRNLETLGKLIRDTRLLKGLSPKEFADDIGHSVAYLADLEAGAVDPSKETLNTCASVLSLKPLSLENSFPKKTRPRSAVLSLTHQQVKMLQTTIDNDQDSLLEQLQSIFPSKRDGELIHALILAGEQDEENSKFLYKLASLVYHNFFPEEHSAGFAAMMRWSLPE